MADPRDNMSRLKQSSSLGTTTFITLRTLDTPIQYAILAKSLASPLLDYLNITHIATYATSSPAAIAFGLPLKPLLILGMAAGTALKQNYWLASIAAEEMPLSKALPIGIFNSVFNSLNSIIALTAASKFLAPEVLTAGELSPMFLLGYLGCFTSLAVETISEVQRRNFKAKPENKGKPFTGGLFGWSRHINYGAYTVMRGSYALACGGWIWGLVVGGFFAVDFINRGVPVMDDYCTKRVSFRPFQILLWVRYANHCGSMVRTGRRISNR